ncbi:hypothetical protein F5Y07DRAFT_130354 [Xylaria sp. FL0933]|nr:hypothetical protein F5Y07DRAFT_130354 [Xylaria sp. FL0933]
MMSGPGCHLSVLMISILYMKARAVIPDFCSFHPAKIRLPNGIRHVPLLCRRGGCRTALETHKSVLTFRSSRFAIHSALITTCMMLSNRTRILTSSAAQNKSHQSRAVLLA